MHPYNDQPIACQEYNQDKMLHRGVAGILGLRHAVRLRLCGALTPPSAPHQSLCHSPA